MRNMVFQAAFGFAAGFFAAKALGREPEWWIMSGVCLLIAMVV